MSDTAAKQAGDGLIVGEIETSILTLLSKAFPNTQQVYPATGGLGDFESLIPQPPEAQLGTMSAEDVHRWRFQTLVDAIKKLRQFGLVRDEGAAGHLYVEITAAGLRWLGRKQPDSSYVDLGNVNRAFTEQLAKMAEVRETIQEIAEENKTLRGQQEELGRRLDTGRAELEQRIGTFEETTDRLEHSFYSQIFTFLAVFVAAFALILTGAQVAIRNPATDPVLLAEQTSAIMGPLTLLLILLVVVAWRVSRWR